VRFTYGASISTRRRGRRRGGGGLSADERTRAARFHFARDRARFLRRRAALRHLLAGYAGREPHALVFAQGAHGKPALPATGLEFSLSHSGGYAVLAVTRGRRVAWTWSG